jgi:hypothetical protein
MTTRKTSAGVSRLLDFQKKEWVKRRHQKNGHALKLGFTKKTLGIISIFRLGALFALLSGQVAQALSTKKSVSDGNS